MYLDDVRQIHIKGLVNQLEERGYQWETQNKVRICCHLSMCRKMNMNSHCFHLYFVEYKKLVTIVIVSYNDNEVKAII